MNQKNLGFANNLFKLREKYDSSYDYLGHFHTGDDLYFCLDTVDTDSGRFLDSSTPNDVFTNKAFNSP